MSNRRKMVWAVAALLLLFFITALRIPRLLRSRISAEESALLSKLRTARMTIQLEEKQGAQLGLLAQAVATDKRLIHNAELGLIVGDVHVAAEQIRKITELDHGEVDKLEITETDGGSLSATLLVRVPALGLEDALAEFKKLAVRTEREQVSTRDVTREFYDNEAHMRNLQAEEQLYLAIMNQAHTVKDTLEVSGKLSDVRDQIERLQAQVQLMTHDIEMSVVTIALMQESEARVFGIRWRPLYNAKIAVRELLVDLGEWLDWVVAILIKLPVIVLWVATVGGILLAVWKIGRSVWVRFLKPKIIEFISSRVQDIAPMAAQILGRLFRKRTDGRPPTIVLQIGASK
jgi:hypothetical protein